MLTIQYPCTHYIRKNFFTVVVTMLQCRVAMFVKKTILNLAIMRADDVSMAKKDVLNAKYLLNGNVCGVLVVNFC